MLPPDALGADGQGCPRVAVAGGSIGGLCAGLALHGAGFDVQVYEQHTGAMETRGAGIVVQPDLGSWGWQAPEDGVPVDDGFVYRSDTNDQWFTR